jgi:hypothetical protein
LLLKQLAFNIEAKVVIAPDADFSMPSGTKLGEFDSTSFFMTFGV